MVDIDNYIKESYEIALEKGFYPPDSHIYEHIMGIVSELGEVYEAHRNNKFSTIEDTPFDINVIIENIGDLDCDSFISKDIYEKHIKDTFEDELADCFIRLFNVCSFIGRHIRIDSQYFYQEGWNTVPGDLYAITSQVMQSDFIFAINMLYGFCKYHNIDIEKYIELKIRYNKTRPKLNGKQY